MVQKLLVIDDSLTVRKMVELTFRDQGWVIEFAVSGGEGVSKALAGAPDLVLLDFVLPDMKATEVCERLAASRPAAALSIILMSAKMERVRELFKGYPMVVDFLGKPFTVAEVMQRAARAQARNGNQPAPPPVMAPTAPAASAAFSYKQKEAAANTLFQALRRELAALPEHCRQLGAAPPATYFGRKLLRLDVVETILDGLAPLYRDAAAERVAPARPSEPQVDGPSLQGQTSSWPLRSLLELLRGSGRTGELLLHHGAQTVRSYWQSGDVLLATSHDPTDYARGAALDLARVPAAEREAAEAEQRASGKPLHVTLHERGALLACDLPALLERQGRRLLVEALAASAARFAWRDRAELPAYAVAHGRHLELAAAGDAREETGMTQLDLERLRRPSTWREVEPHLPGPETVYSRQSGFSARLTGLRLSASEQRVLTLVNGHHSVVGIAERSGIVTREVARILFRLTAVDLIAALHAPSLRGASGRPVMILEPDRDGFHAPLRTLLANRSEPLELVDLAGEPDLLVAIERERPALVILNDSAYDADVSDVARAIRATPQLANVSLAAVLEARAKGKMDDLAAAGFDAVLVKPVLYSDLNKLIASSFLATSSASRTRGMENHGEDPRR